MIRYPAFRTARRVVSTLAFVAVISCICGCKQMSSWTNVAPSAGPAVDPFSVAPTDEGYFHKPEPIQNLSPVPPLPAPGHSIPQELPPPPAPAAAPDNAPTPSGDNITSRSKAPWLLKPMGFFNRKDGKQEPVESAVAAEPTRPSKPRINLTKPSPLPITEQPPLSLPDEVAVETPAPRLSSNLPAVRNFPSHPPAAPLDDSYTGPVITPGAQYTIGRNVPVERWPHSRQQVRLRKPPQFDAEDFAPRTTEPSPAAVALPTPKLTSEPVALPLPARNTAPVQAPTNADVPLLVPPGP